MKVGSLFSGIGGLDLGLERAGMTVAWQSEINPYACRVLAKHWPDVPNLGDITTIDWSDVEPVDLICGGYPCQPFSLAGVRAGEDDPRHLWPHFARAIRELRPRYALLENVPGHLSLGFGSVLGDLAALGYDTDWDCIPAAAVGAPHLRYRIIVVAHANEQQHESGSSPLGWSATEDISADATGGRRDERLHRHGAGSNVRRFDVQKSARRVGSAERIGGGYWATEPDVGRVAHGVPSRVDRLRTLGNAVVPQIAQFVGERIMEHAA